MSEVNINYKGSKIAGMDASGTKTLLTEGKYCEDDIEVVYARPATPSPSFQTKSVTYTPTESQQTDTITADSGYDGLDTVNVSVAAISSTYVGSGIPRKSASDLTQNHQSITAPSGYYSANATFTMAQALGHLTASVDTSGMVTATYDFLTAGYQASGGTAYSMQLTSLAASTYTPSATAQTIPSQRWLVGAQTIEAIPSAYIIPSGTSSITTNGIYNITSFASVDISVSGVTPTGTYSVTSNGIYDITSYASVDVNVSGGGGGSDAEDGIIERTISGTYTNSRVTTIGLNAFYNCSSLATASFPNVTSIDTSAFYNCRQLTTVSFPSVTSIGNYAFYSCSRLTTASFPSATTIGSSAFCQCFQLATVSFPNVTTMGSNAFNTCRSLTTVIFPKATSIGAQAFRNCSNLISFFILASSVAKLGSSAFLSTPMSLSTYTGSFGSIYVPASLVSSYQSATNWKSYSARITSYVE